MFAFEQSLLCLGHFPNIWHAAASHLQEVSRVLSVKGVSFPKSLTANWKILVQIDFDG